MTITIEELSDQLTKEESPYNNYCISNMSGNEIKDLIVKEKMSDSFFMMKNVKQEDINLETIKNAINGVVGFKLMGTLKNAERVNDLNNIITNELSYHGFPYDDYEFVNAHMDVMNKDTVSCTLRNKITGETIKSSVAITTFRALITENGLNEIQLKEYVKMLKGIIDLH